MKQILLLLAAMIFIFVSFEILLQVNYYVLLTFNKLDNKEVSVYKDKRKYKLMVVDLFANINEYIQNKSVKMVK